MTTPLNNGFEEWWQASLKDQTMRTVKESYRAAWQAALTAHNQRLLDLADELEQEADDGERGGFTEDQVYQYAAQRIRQLVKEMGE